MKKILLILFFPLLVNAQITCDFYLNNPKTLNKNFSAYTKAITTPETQRKFFQLELFKTMFLMPFGYPDFKEIEGSVLIRAIIKDDSEHFIFAVRATEKSKIARIANLSKEDLQNTPLQNFTFLKIENSYFFSKYKFESDEDFKLLANQMLPLLDSQYSSDIHIRTNSDFLRKLDSFAITDKLKKDIEKLFTQTKSIESDVNFSARELNVSLAIQAEKNSEIHTALSQDMPAEYSQYLTCENPTNTDENTNFSLLINLSNILNIENKNVIVTSEACFKDDSISIKNSLPIKDSKFLLNHIFKITGLNEK